MSLLMDALKKAEEEKKRAAKQLEDVEGSARTEEPGSKDDTGELLTQGAEQQSDLEKKPASDHLELTLAPLESKALESSDQRLTEEEDKLLSSTHEELNVSRELIDEAKKKQDELDATFSEDRTEEHFAVNKETEASLDKTQNTYSLEATQEALDLDDSVIIEGLSSAEEPAGPSFDDTFHGVVFDDDDGSNYEETLPGVSAEQLSRDLGGGAYQPTPVAAKTVFNAGRTAKDKSSFKWGMFSLLVLLALGSFAIFYYFSITPVARQMPPPDVARGIESTPAAIPRIPPVDNQSVSGTLIAAEDEQVMVAEAVDESVVAETTTTDTPVSEATEEITQVIDATIDTSAPEQTPVAEKPEDVIAEKAVADDSAIAATDKATTELDSSTKQVSNAAAGLPEYIALDQKPIQISKQATADTDAVLVRQAFNAYQRGELTTARSLYSDALAIAPDNRDAHLGLAAIAMKEDDVREAFVHYNHVLSLNPDDALAISALQSLNSNLDPVKGETAIKLLLNKEPDNPYLYFNLGNLYARQQRWPEAQQAFFDAYRLDDKNAAYAMNLAVSLDYMEQYAAALSYYQSAMDLSLAGDASLDASAIQQRINALTSLEQE